MSLKRLKANLVYGDKRTIALVVLTVLILTVYFISTSHTAKTEKKKHKRPFGPNKNRKFAHQHYENLPKDNYKDDKDYYDVGETLDSVPETLMEAEKCPACFGSDICSHLMNSDDFRINIPMGFDVKAEKGVYLGRWAGRYIALKRLSNDEDYRKYDKYLCENVGKGPDCDVSKAIMNPLSFVQQDDAFTPDNLRQAWKIVHPSTEQFPLAACITKDLIYELSKFKDVDNNGKLNKKETAMYFSSLVLNPELLMLKFIDTLAKHSSHLFHHFPTSLGSCGRVSVAEHGGKSLGSLLHKPFDERADYAVQLLSIADRLTNASSKWAFAYHDFHFENIFVTKNGMVYLIDAEDILIVDRVAYPEPEKRLHKTCNRDCMDEFSNRLFNFQFAPRKQVCSEAKLISEQAMYYLVCERILSDLPEHKRGDAAKEKGLLYDFPKEDESEFNDLIRECVHETSTGGRNVAVDRLFTLLGKYASINPNAFVDEYIYSESGSGAESNETHRNNSEMRRKLK